MAEFIVAEHAARAEEVASKPKAEMAQAQERWNRFDYMMDYFQLNLDAESGNTTAQMSYGGPSDAIVRLATASITGSTYEGKLRAFAGVSVRACGIEYSGATQTQLDADSRKAFTIDFGGVRKVSALQVMGDLYSAGLTIVLVLPWMGVAFGEQPLHPSGQDKPQVDGMGKTLVNFAETETAKLFIQFSADIPEPAAGEGTVVDTVLDSVVIKSNTYPLNVRAAVADRPPFFTHAGALVGDVSLPDFSAEVSAYLDALNKSGVASVTSIPLALTTDLPGVLALKGSKIVFDRVATAKWGESTRMPAHFVHQDRQEIVLEFPTSETEEMHINGLSMEITHDFPEWRTFPRLISEVDDKVYARVAPDLNVAQCITATETSELHGISFYITEINSVTELLVELAEDVNGAPGDKALSSTMLKALAAERLQWVDVFPAKPLKITAGKHIWFVVKAKLGAAGIVLQPLQGAGEVPACFNRHGAGWRKFPYKQGQLAVVFRHLRKPATGEGARVVELEFHGRTMSTDLVEVVNSVTFSFFDKETGTGTGPTLMPQDGKVWLTLKIVAHAAGTMTLQNVRIQYQSPSEEND